MRRRTFLATVAASAWTATLGLPGRKTVAEQLVEGVSTLPKRALGTSGVELPVIGFSGLSARGRTHEVVDHAVGVSLDLGINYVDTAASYGNSEEMLAPVIKPYRKDLILATKTRERTREGAEAEFQRSCERLQTDYFDMYLVHGIQHVDRDVDAAFAKGGAMESLVEKKKSGQIRLLGFSAHSTAAAIAAMDRYDFDFFYFPVSYVTWYKGGFGPDVLEKAKETNTPCISLKAMARQQWPDSIPREQRCQGCWYQPIDDPKEGSLALRWALSQPVVSMLPPAPEDFYLRTLAVANDLSPVTPGEAERLQAMAEDKRSLFPR